MPTYEYQREDGSCFECEQSINEETLKKCPKTGQKVTRLISINSFMLRGGGWYKTDYATPSKSECCNSTSKEEKAKPKNNKEEKTKCCGDGGSCT